MASNQNTSLLRSLCEQAEALSCGISNDSFPVLLPPLAQRRRVTGVDFRPLLVDAMLTTHSSGFRCIFNSCGRDPNGLRLQYEAEAPGRLMQPRLRFSVAHELAHTLFYDLSSDRSEERRVGKECRSRWSP